jgi:uncharacterized membrane protein YphA (DoxX/SURF4 family)
MDFSRTKTLKIAVVVLRVILGGLFAYAGYLKLVQPWQLFAADIAEYQVVPMWAATFIARSLPWFEILLGLMVIVGRWTRTSTVLLSGILMVFFSLMVRAKLQGKEIDCGCFGSGEPISWKTLLRDGSMLAGALFLTVTAFRNRRTTASGV